jgi:hypothetical protein
MMLKLNIVDRLRLHISDGAFFGGDQQAVLEYYFLYKSVFKIM